MRKKIIAGMLSVSMILSTAAVLPEGIMDLGANMTVSAAVSGDYEYKALSDGTVEISGYNGSSTSVTIPEKLGGKTVSRIGDQAFYMSKIKTITIPASVKSVGMDAFRESAYLTSVTFSGGTTSIGDYTFYKCTSLKTVKLPSGLKTMGTYVFYGCSALTDIVIPDTVTTMGGYFFENCTALKSVTLPADLTEIKDDTFAWCTSLSTIRVPNKVTAIDWRAFTSCTALTRVILPGSLKKIGEEAFDRCNHLKALSIPGGVTTIGNSAFENCTVLTDVVIPDSVSSIGKYAFGYIHATGATKYEKIKDYVVYGSGDTAKSYAQVYSFKYVDVRLSSCKISIPSKTYAYNKKGVKPSVTITNSAGDKLVKGTDYTLTYQNNKKCGKATVTITGTGKYTGSTKRSFIIKPAKATLSSVKSTKAKKVTVKWKKSAGGVSGYQVQISTDKNFKKGVKTYGVKKAKTVSKTISKLKSKKTYYVRIRAYKLVNNKKYACKWTTAKKVKCK